MTQAEFNAMLQIALGEITPSGYYTSIYSGEEIDELLGNGGGGGGAVTSVNGQTGRVFLTASDVNAKPSSYDPFPATNIAGQFLQSNGSGGVVWQTLINRAEVGA